MFPQTFAAGLRAVSLGAISVIASYALFHGPQAAAAGPSEDSSLPPPRIVESEETLQMEKTKQSVFALFTKHDFNALEELAKRSRRDKTTNGRGTSQIMIFYRAFSAPPPPNSDADWEQMIAGLEDWRKEKPDSVTPKVALAEAWNSYAWGRSHGDNQLMMERLRNANEALEDAKPLRANCPEYYLAYQSVVLYQRWPRDIYDSVTDEGLKLFPDAFYIYMYKCYYLQTRWRGKPGEWEAYLTASADKLGGEEGDLLYARVMDYLDEKSTNIAQIANVSWPRIKRGCEIRLKRYPDSLNGLSAYASLACKFGDWPLARSLFDKLGDRVWLGAWKTEANFVKWRSEAFNER